MDAGSTKPWFWAFRIGLLPVFFFPASWKGVGAITLFLAAVFGWLMLGLSLGFLPKHPAFVLLPLIVFVGALVLVAQRKSKDW